VSSPNKYTWVRLDVALAIHEAVIAEHGGSAGLRDAGLLESALARPQHAWSYSEPQPSAAELAAIYAIAISHNHPFVDGNKRVAFAALEAFLEINSYRLIATDSECITTMWAFAAGSLSDESFTAWVTEHVRPQE
jgi:death-on-curing protein